MRECYWIDDNTSPEDAASVAIQVSSDEWIEFNDHFFQACCDCGLTHRVEIHDKAVGTREVQFVRLDAHTEQMRLRFKRENYAGTYEIERLRAEVARLTAEQDAISANIECVAGRAGQLIFSPYANRSPRSNHARSAQSHTTTSGRAATASAHREAEK